MQYNEDDIKNVFGEASDDMVGDFPYVGYKITEVTFDGLWLQKDMDNVMVSWAKWENYSKKNRK